MIDWEQSRWYPEYWEHRKILSAVDYKHELRAALRLSQQDYDATRRLGPQIPRVGAWSEQNASDNDLVPPTSKRSMDHRQV